MIAGEELLQERGAFARLLRDVGADANAVRFEAHILSGWGSPLDDPGKDRILTKKRWLYQPN